MAHAQVQSKAKISFRGLALTVIKPKYAHYCLVLLIACFIGFTATIYMGIAAFSYGLLCLGLLQRHQMKVHARFMNSAILLDLALVLVLEIQRQAINTALSLSLTPIQQAHIAASTMATILYFPVLGLGWLAYFGFLSPNVRQWHRKLGIAAFVCRTLGFVLMFSML